MITKKNKERKITYYAIDGSGFYFLIPKKRGEGFLRQPVGHHDNKLSKFISYELSCDCVGLDGHLWVECKPYDGRGYIIPNFTEKINFILNFLGFESVEVSVNEIFDYLCKQGIS